MCCEKCLTNLKRKHSQVYKLGTKSNGKKFTRLACFLD
jgi:hypothetical protein